MLATWIETAAKGRLGGPVRAGMWSAAVIGTHPVQDNQRVWLELAADDLSLGLLPAYWIENKGGNSFWHAPIPPQAVGVRLHYRAIVERADGERGPEHLPGYDRPSQPAGPDRVGRFAVAREPKGLVGNRLMTVRVDARGSTYDVYFPTVGLHSYVRPQGRRPAAEPLPFPRRSSAAWPSAGGSTGSRNAAAWDPYQQYQGATNLLTTKLTWRHGPIQVVITDFAAMGDCLPSNAGREKSPGQYIKRFLIKNEGTEARQAIFGGVRAGRDQRRRRRRRLELARHRQVAPGDQPRPRPCQPQAGAGRDRSSSPWRWTAAATSSASRPGPNEAILFRAIELPAGGSVTIDMLVSGAFTGWSGDRGTFEHWLRPALNWFRSADLDEVEHTTAKEWDDFIEPIPDLYFPKPTYAVHLRRSALAAALHADAEWGAIASGFDRGLSAYCWPRDAIWVGGAMERLGHPAIGRGVYQWLNKVRQRHRPFLYWFQKYSIDGVPEWETPAVDQTALIPWGLERHYRRTGDLDLVAAVWPMIEQAARSAAANPAAIPVCGCSRT